MRRFLSACRQRIMSGVVAGGGIEFRAGRLKVSPEFRYTRWNSRYWESPGSRGFFTASNVNQAEGLMSGEILALRTEARSLALSHARYLRLRNDSTPIAHATTP